jgi:curved DNA-binding protein CbpA
VRRAPLTADPFAALGLPASPEVTDADVRSAWRRIAAATHPDRADGGDPARFAAAAAAYTVLRTPFGRNEALADLATPHARRGLASRPAARTHGRGPARWRAARDLPATTTGPAAPDTAAPGTATPGTATPGTAARRGPVAGWPGRRVLAARGLWSRVRRGRPLRLALRAAVAGLVSTAVVLTAGTRPATPALIAGALTWFALTARHDLAPPPPGS